MKIKEPALTVERLWASRIKTNAMLNSARSAESRESVVIALTTIRSRQCGREAGLISLIKEEER